MNSRSCTTSRSCTKKRSPDVDTDSGLASAEVEALGRTVTVDLAHDLKVGRSDSDRRQVTEHDFISSTSADLGDEEPNLVDIDASTGDAWTGLVGRNQYEVDGTIKDGIQDGGYRKETKFCMDRGNRGLKAGMTVEAVTDTILVPTHRAGQWERYFLVKWRDLERPEWILDHIAKTNFPDFVFKFYEETREPTSDSE